MFDYETITLEQYEAYFNDQYGTGETDDFDLLALAEDLTND